MIGDERYHIIQDVPRGLIWISTYGNGLFVYDSQKEEMTHYSYHVDEFNRVNSDFLLYAMGDRTGNIWLGSEYSGIALLSVLMMGQLIFILKMRNWWIVPIPYVWLRVWRMGMCG